MIQYLLVKTSKKKLRPMKKIYFTLIVASILFCACEKDKDENAALSINPPTTTILFTADAAATYSYDVATNQSVWDAVVTPAEATWCKVQKGGTGFVIYAEPNEELEGRGPVTVTVTAGAATPIEITVTQSGMAASSSVYPDLKEITFYAGATDVYDYEVATNVSSWSLTASESWIKAEKDSQGTGFTIGAELYSGDQTRTGTVTLKTEGLEDYVITVTQNAMEIYVLAYAYLPNSYTSADAVYWKNGEKNILASAGESSGWFPNRMVVSKDNIVHAVGRLGGGGVSYAIYFHGTKGTFDITDTVGASYNSVASDIFIDDEDNLYVSGYIGPTLVNEDDPTTTVFGVMWKNWEKTEISEHLQTATTSSMDLYNGDVYIAGKTSNSAGGTDFVYWKNGDKNIITAGDGWGGATDIKIKDGKVYVAGFSTNMSSYEYEAYYWIDGTMSRLNPIEGNDMIYGLDVSDSGDVYMAGATGGTGWARKAMYTKNTQKIILTEGENLNAVSSAVRIWGDDIYVIATQFNNETERRSVGKLYRNGVEIMEFDGDGSVWVTDLVLR